VYGKAFTTLLYNGKCIYVVLMISMNYTTKKGNTSSESLDLLSSRIVLEDFINAKERKYFRKFRQGLVLLVRSLRYCPQNLKREENLPKIRVF